jgi:hypothetical protein
LTEAQTEDRFVVAHARAHLGALNYPTAFGAFRRFSPAF